jgi:hypothetical protein
MKTRNMIGASVLCAAAFAAAGMMAFADEPRAGTPKPEAKSAECPMHANEAGASLEKIKALAGEWEAFDDKGVKFSTVTYHVTSAGSAVVETLFPGQEHEMVTIYHMDNGVLMCTHYCAMGNQPRLKCVTEKDNVLTFEHRDCTNVKTDVEPRMGRLTMTLKSSDEIRTDWRMVADGKPAADGKVFNLKRKK